MSTSVDSADFSKAGELFSKLQQLQETDPDKFKEVCANISEQLSEAAEDEDGSAEGMLTDLASKFKEASKTGDMSSLQPPPPPPPSQCRMFPNSTRRMSRPANPARRTLSIVSSPVF